MTIHEAALYTHIKAETIRSYRKRGLVHPAANPSNGYYNYSYEDLLALLFIRKLRGIGLPLDAISFILANDNTADIIAVIKGELANLDEQIFRLQHHRSMLARSIPMLEAYEKNLDGPCLQDFKEERIDCYDLPPSDDPIYDAWLEQIELFTQSIWISREYFSCDPLPEKIPIRLGIGTFKLVYEQYGIPMPENAVHCPSGHYVTGKIELDNLHFVSGDQLKPMVDFIQANHLHVISDTTGFLLRLEWKGQNYQFCYRLRIQVE